MHRYGVRINLRRRLRNKSNRVCCRIVYSQTGIGLPRLQFVIPPLNYRRPKTIDESDIDRFRSINSVNLTRRVKITNIQPKWREY
jgi:hypothetical protein